MGNGKKRKDIVMKIGMYFLSFMLFCSFNSVAQKETESIEATISGFFDGLSEFNFDKLKDLTTSDFLLLEDGQVWNLDTLINKVSPRKSLNIIRVNKFQFIKTEQYDNIAWVSYFNTAEFTQGEKHQTVKWLESAVLIKEKGRWRIQQLHSTKLNK